MIGSYACPGAFVPGSAYCNGTTGFSSPDFEWIVFSLSAVYKSYQIHISIYYLLIRSGDTALYLYRMFRIGIQCVITIQITIIGIRYGAVLMMQKNTDGLSLVLFLLQQSMADRLFWLGVSSICSFLGCDEMGYSIFLSESGCSSNQNLRSKLGAISDDSCLVTACFNNFGKVCCSPSNVFCVVGKNRLHGYVTCQ